ncbi:MAG TPA: precorrin-6y C5,15-methyltransferase (decarboxylating) subunit CbiE [Acidimicrobiales bacterium]|nr:precorrin-6y C5,15-methyltransferase (decarboxylating) subunit CbiE [Acidimicrobiales bacterium]
MAERIDVVGLVGDRVDGLVEAAVAAIGQADLLIGSPRLLDGVDAIANPSCARLALSGDLGAMTEAIEKQTGRSCVLASGDPGFFGVVRPLAERFGPAALRVHPGPSSVALAFARLGWNWDDAAVVSAHGRPLEDAARLVARLSKVAVLVSPESPPEALGRALIAQGAVHQFVAVCARLGAASERVDVVDLAALAAGSWDPLSVVVLSVRPGPAVSASLAWGRPEDAFAHRAGMVTKGEVRAAVLGQLDLPGPSSQGSVLWDLGAGSGSVAVESNLLAPWLDVVAVEQGAADAARIRDNARAHGVAVRVIEGDALDVMAGLPDPDRVFVGGGGLDVLDAARARLLPGGHIVATFTALDRAAGAAERLGHLVQIAVNRGRRLPGGGWRLEPDNPVFLAWGSGP